MAVERMDNVGIVVEDLDAAIEFFTELGMFTVDDIDDTLARLGKRGAELVGEVVQYESAYRLCYITRGQG
jgi:catechol 2,3-dioxygenase-like lactoylglutathione lyase family enzyme